MLATALQVEVAAYVDAYADLLDPDGRRLVVRNGSHAPREVMTAAGAVPVRAPRATTSASIATGERVRFSSAILLAWARKSPKVAEVVPLNGGQLLPLLLGGTLARTAPGSTACASGLVTDPPFHPKLAGGQILLLPWPQSAGRRTERILTEPWRVVTTVGTAPAGGYGHVVVSRVLARTARSAAL